MKKLIWLVYLVSTLAISSEQRWNSEAHLKTTNYNDLIKDFKLNPIWAHNGEDFYFYDNLKDEFVSIKSKRANRKVLLSSDGIQTVLDLLSKESGEELTHFEEVYKTFKKRFNQLSFKVGDYRFFIDQNKLNLESKKEELEPVKRKIKDPTFKGTWTQYESLSPNKKYLVGFDKNNQLTIRKALTDYYIQLKVNSDISFDNEFEWNVGELKFSANSQKFIITATNNKNVARYPLITDWQADLPVVDVNIPYITPKDKLAPEYLFSVDLLNKRIDKIEIPNARDEYRVYMNGWIDHQSFVFNTVDRLYSVRRYFIKDQNGVREWFKESSNSYLIDHPLNIRSHSLKIFNKRAYLISESDGKADLYTVSLKTGKRKKLFESDLIIEEILLRHNGAIYFTVLNGDKDNPYHLHLFSFGKNGLKRKTELGRTHAYNAFEKGIFGDRSTVKVVFSPNKKFFLDYASSLNSQLKVSLKWLRSGKTRMHLGESDITELKKLNWTAPEKFKVRTADNTVDLHGVLFKPFDFDPKKKYPVVNFIYGGPQVVWTPQKFKTSEHSFATSMAQLGYIVVMMDARGTPDRGKAFQDYNYKRFGQVEVFDHVHVLKELGKRNPYMDIDRLGVVGSSYGGFQTLKFMTLAPKFFKVGVANVAVSDLRRVHQGSVQMYMGDVIENHEGYERSSVVSQIDNLEGKLLIMHGAQDINAPLFGMMRLMHEMIERDIDYDFFLLPQNAHARNAYTWKKIKRYFLEHL